MDRRSRANAAGRPDLSGRRSGARTWGTHGSEGIAYTSVRAYAGHRAGANRLDRSDSGDRIMLVGPIHPAPFFHPDHILWIFRGVVLLSSDWWGGGYDCLCHHDAAEVFSQVYSHIRAL